MTVTTESRTELSDVEVAGSVVATDRYPVTEPGSAAWARAVAAARRDLDDQGCCVLRDFVRPRLHARLAEEGAGIADRAHVEVSTVNVYNTAPDPGLPPEHPARLPMLRSNAFVPRDRIPSHLIIHRLYANVMFQRFLAACLGVAEIHPLADPLAALCLNVVEPGREHPWHFDTNEFAVSLLTRPPGGGGVFEYCPNIRRPGAENVADVRAVLVGEGEHLVRRLVLRPGDLQLFRGRYALHRVSRVQGTVARHTAIFSYSERPGVVGQAERTRQLFGRLTPAHEPGVPGTRVDALLD